jgi:hypothetical protein
LIGVVHLSIKNAFERQKCLGWSSGTVGWKCDGKRYAAHTEVWGIPETMVR